MARSALGIEGGEAGFDAILYRQEAAEHVSRREEIREQVDARSLFR